MDKKGADDSLSHGIGRLKAIAYAGVKDVIEKRVIIDFDFNHKERGYNSFIIAAPISIKGENYICEVVIKQNKNESWFYLHEVTEQKKFLNRAFVTNLAQKPAQKGTIINLLNNLTSVNESISCPMSDNGEPEKDFVSKILPKNFYLELTNPIQTMTLGRWGCLRFRSQKENLPES